jgi:hypothetical protein
MSSCVKRTSRVHALQIFGTAGPMRHQGEQVARLCSGRIMTCEGGFSIPA